MEDARKFLTLTAQALTDRTLHKLALGKPGPDAGGLVGISGKPVELKGVMKLCLTFRTARQEEVKNLLPEEISGTLLPLLGSSFLQADLYTSHGSTHLLFSRKGSSKLLAKTQVVTVQPDNHHDKKKFRRLDLTASPWSSPLGLADSQSRPVAAMKDKIHQLEKFLELVDHQLKSQETLEFSTERPLRILDLGAGKGYLSFALYQWLTRDKGWSVDLEAVEVQKDLCDLGNRVAQDVGYTGLRFTCARIDQISPAARDMVIVLHACDTATDDALALGIRSGARWIFAAPCCHQELRASMKLRGGLESILRHGILLERQAEILTDGLRSLVLESFGYVTKVQEFVPAEHSGKNLLITARRKEPAPPLRDAGVQEEIRKISSLFGLEGVYLERLLGLDDLGDLTPSWRRLGPVAKESLTTKG